MKGVIESYEKFLPITPKTPRITLLEGNTPLIYLENISRQYGVKVYVKYEGANPTGSFKDRGMVLAIAKAIEEGSRGLSAPRRGTPLPLRRRTPPGPA